MLTNHKRSDFKIGQRVRGVSDFYTDAGLRNGEEGTVVEIGRLGIGVRHARNDVAWLLYPSHLQIIPEDKPVTAPTVADDLRITPQARTVLRHLKTEGSITPMRALTVYGITRLASCIHEIRQKARYSVATDLKRDAQGHKYSKYRLATA